MNLGRMSALLGVLRHFSFQEKLCFWGLKSFILRISYQILVKVDMCCSDLQGTCWHEGKMWNIHKFLRIGRVLDVL